MWTWLWIFPVFRMSGWLCRCPRWPKVTAVFFFSRLPREVTILSLPCLRTVSICPICRKEVAKEVRGLCRLKPAAALAHPTSLGLSSTINSHLFSAFISIFIILHFSSRSPISLSCLTVTSPPSLPFPKIFSYQALAPKLTWFWGFTSQSHTALKHPSGVMTPLLSEVRHWKHW